MVEAIDYSLLKTFACPRDVSVSPSLLLRCGTFWLQSRSSAPKKQDGLGHGYAEARAESLNSKCAPGINKKKAGKDIYIK